MVTMVQRFSRPQTAAMVVLGWITLASAGTSTGSSPQSLDWSLHAAKNAYYPGEPVLLTLTIKNNGSQQEEVDFGTDSIQGFSMEIRSSAGEIVAKGGHIDRYGTSIRGPLPVPPERVADKSIVFNQWCSTQLLPVGTYEVVCHTEYRLGSEVQKQSGTIVRKAGPVRTIEFKLDISIAQMNVPEFKGILEKLRMQAFPPEVSNAKQKKERETAREMLIFTESALAVPYQLEALPTAPSSWLKRDAINSLAKSKAVDAAIGLVKFSEGSNIDDVRYDLIKAVYRMRDTGEPDIIKATDEFTRKHARPIPSQRGARAGASN
jgi:hypothetical protein